MCPPSDNPQFPHRRHPIAPDKADTPLVVDAEAVPPLPVALQRFQVIAGWGSQIAKVHRDVQLPQLALGNTLAGAKAFDALPGMKLLRLRRPEGLDHISAYNGKRRM
jgi:hypothetical protein